MQMVIGAKLKTVFHTIGRVPYYRHRSVAAYRLQKPILWLFLKALANELRCTLMKFLATKRLSLKI